MSAQMQERDFITRLAAGMPRSPRQLNGLHESDAELVALPETGTVLAVTTDSVVEEIASGLYDPYLAGWMCVTVSASDLAAVGAEPIGILISESLPPDCPPDAIRRLQAGIRDASVAHGLAVLGGDTNSSPTLQLTGTALGVLGDRRPLTRRGARPGDLLFASGPVGLGTAFAFDRLITGQAREKQDIAYRPIARLGEGRIVARWASACMDTSDGVIATLDELACMNRLGVVSHATWTDLLHPAALQTAVAAGVPPWTMLAGPHGEFELLFSVPPGKCGRFLADAATIGWAPIPFAEIVSEPGYRHSAEDEWLVFDTTRIRSLFAEVGGDPLRYMQELLSSSAPFRK